MPRRSGRQLHVGLLTLAAIAIGVLPSSAQSSASSTPPPTQDATLRLQLGLGNPAGCLPLLGLKPGDDIAAEITRLGR